MSIYTIRNIENSDSIILEHNDITEFIKVFNRTIHYIDFNHKDNEIHIKNMYTQKTNFSFRYDDFKELIDYSTGSSVTEDRETISNIITLIEKLIADPFFFTGTTI